MLAYYISIPAAAFQATAYYTSTLTNNERNSSGLQSIADGYDLPAHAGLEAFHAIVSPPWLLQALPPNHHDARHADRSWSSFLSIFCGNSK